jgi:hypothetical protein
MNWPMGWETLWKLICRWKHVKTRENTWKHVQISKPLSKRIFASQNDFVISRMVTESSIFQADDLPDFLRPTTIQSIRSDAFNLHSASILCWNPTCHLRTRYSSVFNLPNLQGMAWKLHEMRGNSVDFRHVVIVWDHYTCKTWTNWMEALPIRCSVAIGLSTQFEY